ncbi:MAG: DUF998 domain-containing protein [Actinomycetota bacterium]|nr:DUF998 domain-containing protein [Actinomycetota bacterium]
MSTLLQTTRQSRGLLACGVIAGPIFVSTFLIQSVTRDGFDLGHHPISLLSLGDKGWIQITNFILAGVLSLAFAAGVRRRIPYGKGVVWGPRLLTVYGLGLIAGGVFVADPGLGYPAGTPDGVAAELSWHGMLHAAAPPIAFLALIAACLVCARRFATDGERVWASYSVTTAVVCLMLSAWPGIDGMSVRLAVAVTLGFAWQVAFAVRLLRTAR